MVLRNKEWMLRIFYRTTAGHIHSNIWNFTIFEGPWQISSAESCWADSKSYPAPLWQCIYYLPHLFRAVSWSGWGKETPFTLWQGSNLREDEDHAGAKTAAVFQAVAGRLGRETAISQERRGKCTAVPKKHFENLLLIFWITELLHHTRQERRPAMSISSDILS